MSGLGVDLNRSEQEIWRGLLNRLLKMFGFRSVWGITMQEENSFSRFTSPVDLVSMLHLLTLLPVSHILSPTALCVCVAVYTSKLNFR